MGLHLRTSSAQNQLPCFEFHRSSFALPGQKIEAFTCHPASLPFPVQPIVSGPTFPLPALPTSNTEPCEPCTHYLVESISPRMLSRFAEFYHPASHAPSEELCLLLAVQSIRTHCDEYRDIDMSQNNYLEAKAFGPSPTFLTSFQIHYAMTRLPMFDSSNVVHVCSSLTFQSAMRVLPLATTKGKAILCNLDFFAYCPHTHLFPVVNLANKAVRITFLFRVGS
jgi:hypothetical protein